MSAAKRQLLLRAGLRVLALVLLLVALLDPELPIGGTAMDVAVLVDDSASVQRNTLDTRWPGIAETLRRLPHGHRDILRFAGTPVLEHSFTTPAQVPPGGMPRTQVLDRRGTDIAAALVAGLHRLHPQRAGTLILATDGGENRGDATRILNDARRAGVTVLALDMREPALQPRLGEWQIPERARIGQSVQATAIVRGGAASRVGIEILVDDVVAQRQSLQLADGADAAARFVVTPTQSGAVRIGFRVSDPAGKEIDYQPVAAIIDVHGPPSILFVAEKATAVLASSLRAGGFDVEIITPAQLDGRAQHLARYHAVVLDDVRAAGLSVAAQRALADVVQRHGTGLVVLGGRSSFAAGAYRHSELEQLLPVTAEPPEPQREANVMFLVDNSGSMGQAPQGVSRLDIAREAVLETARSLSDADRVSLASFSVEPVLHLAAGNYPDPQARLDAAWRFSAQGGTTLAPALRLAASTLSGEDNAQNLLVLVTDGFLAGTDLAFARQILAASRVELIALAIGGESDLGALESLASAHEGRVLKVDRIAELPRLMRQAVEASKQPTFEGPSELQVPGVLPEEFPQTKTWPPVSGFAVTRPRDDATVFIRAKSGEAVLVEHMSGAGRVVVFTPGIGEFTSGWGGWSEWPVFAGGLLERVSPLLPSARVGMNVIDEPDYLSIEVDLRDASGGWQSAARPLVTLARPDGTTVTSAALPGAPGRYIARVAAASTGTYAIAVSSGDAIVRKSHVRHTADDPPLAADGGRLNEWIASGLLEPLTGTSIEILERKATASVRALLTGLALATLVLIWAGERLWAPLDARLAVLARKLGRRLTLVWRGAPA